MKFIQVMACVAASAMLCCSGWALAQSARSAEESVAFRREHFRQVGGAFKAVNDEVRAGRPDLHRLHANAQTLARLSGDLPTWFPAGSGVGNGLRTRAKAEIWSNSVGFAERAGAFRAAAQDLSNAAAGGDIVAIRTQTRALGARCASCHTDFREPE
jgi:cytochrome c556